MSDDDVIAQRHNLRVPPPEQPHCLRCLAETEAITIGAENGVTTTRLYRYVYAWWLRAASFQCFKVIYLSLTQHTRVFFYFTLFRCQETACVVCNTSITTHVVYDVRALSDTIRWKMWKGVAGTKAGIAGKWFEVNGPVPEDAMHSIALKASAQEFEPDTNSKRVSLGYCFVDMDTLAAFLRLQDFGKGQGLFAFSGNGSVSVCVVPVTMTYCRTKVGFQAYTTSVRVEYNVVTIPVQNDAQIDWPVDYEADIRMWPFRPSSSYYMPKTAIQEWIGEKLKALSAAERKKSAAIRLVKPELKIAVDAFESQEEDSFEDSFSDRDDSDGGAMLEERAERAERMGVARRGRKVRRGYGGRGKWGGLNNRVEPIVLRYNQAIKEHNRSREKQIMRVNRKWKGG